MPPHNRTMVVTGAAMLWVGWFGFNAGSSWAADGLAGMAMLVTHISAATGALTWMAIEWIKGGKAYNCGNSYWNGSWISHYHSSSWKCWS